MTGISHFCIKPTASSISFGMHRARRVADMGQSPALKPAPNIRGCGIFVPGCRCFFVFFQDIDNYVTRMYTKFWILERFITYTIDEYWKVALNTLRVIFS